MLAELAAVVRECDAGFAAFRFHDAVERLYDTSWHSFCDWYIEMVKLRLADAADPDSRRAAVWTAVTTLDVLLRLLHPFMPFVTEECAQLLPNAAPTLQQRAWPEVDALWTDDATTRRASRDRRGHRARAAHPRARPRARCAARRADRIRVRGPCRRRHGADEAHQPR